MTMTTASGEQSAETIFRGGTTLGLDPARLLEQFIARRDEAAFAAILTQHGPMVLATCRRILPDHADADDAFQATFLVLARQAASIHDPDRLAPWLHNVARRAAVRSRTLTARRNRVETHDDAPLVAAPPTRDDTAELRVVLDEELSRLPAKYREPLVLCYLEGLTHDEAAGQLDWPVGTVRSRLAGGRDRLRGRLARRGFAPGALAVLSPASLPVSAVSRILQANTVRLVCTASAGKVATSAALLAQGVLTSMFFAKVQTAAIATLAVAATLAAGTAGVVAQQQLAADSPTTPFVPHLRVVVPNQSAALPPLAGNYTAAVDRIRALEAELAAIRRSIEPVPVNSPIDLAAELRAARATIKAYEAELAVRGARFTSRLSATTPNDVVLQAVPAVPTPPIHPAGGDRATSTVTVIADLDAAPTPMPTPPSPPATPSTPAAVTPPVTPAAPVVPTPPATPAGGPEGTTTITTTSRSDGSTTKTTSEVVRSDPYGKSWVSSLAGGKKVLILPAERHWVSIIDATRPTYAPGSTKAVYQSPDEGVKLSYVGGTGNDNRLVGNVLTATLGVGISANGPRITQGAAYGDDDHKWYPVNLVEPILNGSLSPLVANGQVYYVVGRHLYAFSHQTKRWGVLELKQPLVIDGTKPLGGQHGIMLNPSSMIVPEGDILHIFSTETGQWSHVNYKEAR